MRFSEKSNKKRSNGVKIAIAADHRGFELKEKLKLQLKKAGYAVKDFGCDSEQSVDYPAYALLVAESVRREESERGILICATGIGMSVAANKVPGIRAALVHDTQGARAAGKHTNANILCLGSRTSCRQAKKFVVLWLNTSFAGEQHLRRINEIIQIERKYSGA